MGQRATICVAIVALWIGCAAEQEAGCVGNDVITPICGFLPPEDVHALPEGDALVVGGFSIDNEDGDIRVLRLADQDIQVVYTPEAGVVASGEPWGDPGCPGPPTAGFAAHGIHLSENAEGTYTLLVVNHTGRESVEWLELRREDARHARGQDHQGTAHAHQLLVVQGSGDTIFN